jgi:hypothetical protein
MSVRFVASVDPDTLTLLTSAFDDAWRVHSSSCEASDPVAMRQLLASRIFQAYHEGACDTHSLIAAALHGLITH